MSRAGNTALEHFLEQCRERCMEVMSDRLGSLPAQPSRLAEAMAYASLQGGKRLRPALVYASARAAGGATGLSDSAACALELIHCYSLVHDDLPAMDDDDLRRGRPTTHRAFGEATAILAGDALQSLAFRILSEPEPDTAGDAEVRLRMINILARASGQEGMAGGQSIDIEATERQLTLADLERMHRLKTGALIEASVELGALSAGLDSQSALQCLRDYAGFIGLAFQVQDDILDVTGDTGTLGKTGGADAARNKPTYTSLLGLQGARDKAHELTQQATSALATFGPEADLLRRVADYITARLH